MITRLRAQALAFIAVCVIAPSAAAQLDPAKVAAVVKAADEFVALTKEAAQTGKPPRHTDPAVSRVFDIVFDVSDLERAGVLPFNESAGPLIAWLNAALRVGTVYMLAGTGTTDVLNLGGRPIQAQVDRNTVTFAPELGRFFDAQFRIQATMLDMVRAYLPTTTEAQRARPQFVAGLLQIRSGAVQTLQGFFEVLALPGLSNEWKQERIAWLVPLIPAYAKFLQPDELNSLRASANQVSTQVTDENLQFSLRRIAGLLTPTP